MFIEQGKAVITFLDAILDKTLRSTVALIAARGRGKSAALGLAIGGAVAAGSLFQYFFHNNFHLCFCPLTSCSFIIQVFQYICDGPKSREFEDIV